MSTHVAPTCPRLWCEEKHPHGGMWFPSWRRLLLLAFVGEYFKWLCDVLLQCVGVFSLNGGLCIHPCRVVGLLLYMLWLLWPFIQTVVYVENSYDAFGEEILVAVMCMVSVPKVAVLEILKSTNGAALCKM